MILRVVRAGVCGPSHLSLAFNDGSKGTADLAPLFGGPVLEPLRRLEYFARAELDAVCGTVAWRNGADFAPEVLRELVGESAES